MQTTLDLLDRALRTVDSERELARSLKLSSTAINMAKRRGRLSPTIAGQIAARLGEPVLEWVAIAAIEAEPTAPGSGPLKRLVGAVRNL